MPCDAIATVKADIKNLEKLLTPENIIKPLQEYFWKNFYINPKVTINKGILQIHLDNAEIYVKGAEVTVYGPDIETSNKMAQKLAQLLKELAGALMQRKVLNIVKQKAQVTNTTMAPNKALVIKAKI